jgi:hypothetical protein
LHSYDFIDKQYFPKRKQISLSEFEKKEEPSQNNKKKTEKSPVEIFADFILSVLKKFTFWEMFFGCALVVIT